MERLGGSLEYWEEMDLFKRRAVIEVLNAVELAKE